MDANTAVSVVAGGSLLAAGAVGATSLAQESAATSYIQMALDSSCCSSLPLLLSGPLSSFCPDTAAAALSAETRRRCSTVCLPPKSFESGGSER